MSEGVRKKASSGTSLWQGEQRFSCLRDNAEQDAEEQQLSRIRARSYDIHPQHLRERAVPHALEERHDDAEANAVAKGFAEDAGLWQP